MIKEFLFKMLASGEGLPFDNGTYIFFTILAIAILAGLSVLLVFRIKKGLKEAKQYGTDKGLMSFDRFKVVVNNLCKQNTKKLKMI